jgi:uncharacterized protein YfaS (alpha-2-macroglobulin family)
MVGRAIRVIVTWLIVCGVITAGNTVLAQDTGESQPMARLSIGRLKALEGSEFFTIEVACHLDLPQRQPHPPPCQVQATDAAAYIQVEPRVEFQVVAGTGRFRLVGAFAPRTEYTITFLPGLADGSQAILTEAVSKTVKTPGLTPRLRLLGRARYLPRLQGATLPFEARNVERLRVSFRQIFPQNIIFWLSKDQEEASNDVAEEVRHLDMRLHAKPDDKVTGIIDLDELDRFGPGVFQIVVDLWHDDGTTSRLDSATVVITDVATVAKQDGDDLYVWTRSAVDMRARPGVHVRVMTYSNREIASCTTSGSQAGCVLKDVMRQPQKPYALLLTSGGELSYLRFTDVEIIDERVHAGRRPYVQEGVALEAYVYSSRGVYRPGETVDLGAVVWTVAHRAAQHVPLHWQILTPRNKVLKEASMKSSGFGMAALQVKLDDLAPTGQYQAIVKSGDKHLQTYGFFVEQFVPERIKVTVAATQDVFVGTAMAAFDLEATYLFGPPVANGDYTLRCTLQPAWFTVPGNRQFSTGTYLQHPPRPIVLEPVMGTLDAQGRATARCDYQRFLDAFPSVMQVRADVEVRESGSGRVSLESGTALASATDEIVGLRSLQAANQQIHLEGKLFSPTGAESRRQAQVAVSLYRVEVNWVYVQDPERGYYRWQREEVLLLEAGPRTFEVTNGRFEAQFDTQNTYGAYVIRARLTDTQVVADVKVSLGYTWFWQAAGEATTPRPPSPDHLELLLSRTEVNAGEAVKVRFEAPFAGYLLLAVESDRLLTHRWVEIHKGPQEFEITAPDVLPNVYVSVLLLKDPIEDTFYVPGRAWGSASLQIAPRQYSMQIDVEAPPEMRPQQDLEITLRAHPQESTQFTVAVVDEGILQLTDFQTPDPGGYFFQPRRLGVHTFETVGWTFARTLEPQRDPGGGAAKTPRKAAVIPVTIVSRWSGIVDSDAQGTAVVRVPIPQFQGKVRVMVVAASQGRVGNAERLVTVRDPLVLQATLPRFLIWNDTFSIPVFVVNATGARQDVTVDVRANEVIELPAATLSGGIEDQQSRVFEVPARVRGFAGTASLVITASGGSFTTSETIKIPILPFTPEKTVATTVQAGEDIALADLIPADLRPEELRLEVSVSTVPFLQQLGRLRYLLHYPYGCIEQTTSGTFPLLYMSDLLPWIDPEAAQEHDLTDMVYAGINRLLSMQTTSGGFGYWPGHNEPTLWGTAYVTHLLLKARELGYDVPARAVDDALDFLQEAVSSRRYRYDRKYQRTLVQSEPYMLYVLGLAGRHQQGRLRQLAQQPPQWHEMETENTFLLMLAYYLAGDREAYETYTRRQALLQPVTFSGRYYSGTFWSGLRTDAMRLSLSEDLWPGDVGLEPLAQKVASSLKSRRYLSTQEISWSVSALGKRAQRYRGVDITNVELQLDGQTIAPTVRDQKAPVWLLSGYDFASQHLTLTYTSEKPPFVSIRMHGYAQDYASLSGRPVPFTLSRRYLDLRGQPLGPRALAQGALAVVELTIDSTSAEDIPNIAVVDRLPAGLEIENPRLGRGHQLDWLPDEELFEPDYIDLRDDRLQIFGTLPMRGYKQPKSTRRFYYVVRAVTPGDFTAPPALLEVMYDPEQAYYTDYERLLIESR